MLGIECYIAVGCASREGLLANIAEALRLEHAEADVRVLPLDAGTAIRLQLGGSPSVLVGGTQIEPTGRVGFA